MSQFELPDNWAFATISEVAIKGDQRAPDQDETFTYVDIGSIDRVLKRISDPQILMGKNAPSRARKAIRNGDVLVSLTRPNLNAVALVTSEFDGQIASTGFEVIRPCLVDSRYIFGLTRSKEFIDSISGAVQGALYPAAKSSDVQGFKFPLPPLAEQKIIADKLDILLAQVESIKARLERIPKILKQFRQSVLAAAVSGKLTEEWRRNNPTEVVSNDELLSLHKAFWLQEKEREFQQKGKLPSNDKWRSMYKPPELIDIEKCWQTPETWAWVTIDSISFVTKLAGFEFTKSVKYIEDGEISVIKAENVGKDGFRSTNFSKVAKEVVESLPRSELFGDELLVVFVGAGVGQVGLVPSDQKYFLGPNVAVVRKTTGVYTSKFMELILRSPLGQKNLLSFSKGAAQPSLSMGQIRQTTIPVPPLNEQELIILKLENLFNKANAIETQVLSALDRVNNLTQSILAKAFCGELTAEWREANTELIIGENSAEALLERIKAERELAKPATKRGRGKS
ncbi:restriction endonuclease subunit S [Acinetobacter pittii]|uniref:restriction endonuclease subunit S n=1 Tax=Acinetobacter pittii TaxID=48296 RepID=UPI00197F9D53|nr:restriction endonuclease subunit S [Acinetobacter pittii]MBN6516014.1 restriction endonuclease subunit S [Acinetobacter pittii]